MILKEYKSKYNEDDAVGWDAIEQQIKTIYPDQEPKHYATILKFMLGGEDPLDGVSEYKSEKQQDHLHFVSFGMSKLYYDEESVGGEHSGWGFEFTFRLKPLVEDNGDHTWVVSLMQNLARYVFNTQNWFEEYHFIPANGPIRLDTNTEITALAFVEDPELGNIETPHGKVQFLQLVGLTSKEYNSIKKQGSKEEAKNLLMELKKGNPLLITDLART